MAVGKWVGREKNTPQNHSGRGGPSVAWRHFRFPDTPQRDSAGVGWGVGERNSVAIGPIAGSEQLLDLASLVAAFPGFSGAILQLTEGMFRVADGLVYYLERFRHDTNSFRGSRKARRVPSFGPRSC